eukprot:6123322-Amphidinium_carterae.1
MGARSQDRASSRAVAREDKLKHKQDEKRDKQERKDRRNASTSPPRTVIASPGSPLPTPLSDVVPGASPKKQAKPANNSIDARMDVDDVDSGAKRARACDSQVDVSDSSKLDDLWRRLPEFGKMFELVEQHTQDMRRHGQELSDLRKRVAKLEESKGQPAYSDTPRPPPPPVSTQQPQQ